MNMTFVIAVNKQEFWWRLSAEGSGPSGWGPVVTKGRPGYQACECLELVFYDKVKDQTEEETIKIGPIGSRYILKDPRK